MKLHDIVRKQTSPQTVASERTHRKKGDLPPYLDTKKHKEKRKEQKTRQEELKKEKEREREERAKRLQKEMLARQSRERYLDTVRGLRTL